MPEIYLDDLEPGQVHDLGRRTLTRDEIVAFAGAWDPQPFHLDERAAAASIYGGLIASGWHTVCVFMRLFVDGLLNRAAAMGSPGVDELRWLRPVRPGDTLAARLEVLEVRPSRSKPDRGQRARALGDGEPGRRGGLDLRRDLAVQAPAASSGSGGRGPLSPERLSRRARRAGRSGPLGQLQMMSVVSAKGVKPASPASGGLSKYARLCISARRLTVRWNSNAPSPAG